MNPGIPRSARDALANQRPGEEHPSADMLNGYVEQSLSAAEKAAVMQHLAACEDCREVVFLAGAAAGEPAVAPVTEPARAWRGWKWAVPIAAVLALASSILVERREASVPPRPAISQTANNQAGTPPSPPVPSQTTERNEGPTSEMAANPTHQAKPAVQNRAAVTGGKKSLTHEQVAPAAGMTAETSREEREALAELTKPIPSAVATAAVAQNAAGTSSPAASPLQAAVGQQPAPALGALGRSNFASANKTALGIVGGNRLAIAPHSLWRIAPEGHLEHHLADGTWTRALADQPVSFRAVAVVGNDVWAGGDGGALFHSVDGGEHWSRVVLSADGHAETSAVVSIGFVTVSQGSIATEAGTKWTTSDRGQTWNKQ